MCSGTSYAPGSSCPLWASWELLLEALPPFAPCCVSLRGFMFGPLHLQPCGLGDLLTSCFPRPVPSDPCIWIPSECSSSPTCNPSLLYSLCRDSSSYIPVGFLLKVFFPGTFCIFLAMPHSLQDLSSLTRYQAPTHHNESPKS